MLISLIFWYRVSKVSGSLVVAEMPLITASSSSFTTTRQVAV